MIGVVFGTLRKLSGFFDLHRWVVRFTGLPQSPENQSGRGLIFIQIDGLSHGHFQKAMAEDYLPFLKRLKKNEHYQDWHHYSGIPSCTPSIQGELFYGVKQAVPAFKFRDHETGKIFLFYNSATAAEIETRLAKKGEALLAHGSSYSNIYRGGAEENAHFCAASIGWRAFLKAVHPRTLAGLVILNLFSFVRILYFLLVETVFGFMDSVVGSFSGFGFANEFKFILSRLVVTVGLRELAVLGTKLDIARGLPVIHVNFFGYDDQAHRRGPGSPFAYWALPGIDDAVRRIWKYAQGSLTRDYEIWIYSDHGQEEVIPYADETGKTIEKAVADLFHQLLPNENFESAHDNGWGHQGCRPLAPPAESNAGQFSHQDLVVAAQGPVGFIYPHRKLNSSEKARFAQALVQNVKVPLVLTLIDGKVYGFTCDRNFQLPEEAEALLGLRHPYLQDVAQELVQLCHHPDTGDFILSGWRQGRRSVSFPPEYGSHAGPGPHETDGFAFLPKEIKLATGERNYLRPLVLRETALKFLKGDETVFFEKAPQRREKCHLRVMTYNVHSCRGMDGKFSLERIARVIARHDPDIIALQELDAGRNRTQGLHQARSLADFLDMQHHFHAVQTVEEEMYGNAILSRYPMKVVHAGSLPRLHSAPLFEPRGALWVEIDFQGVPIQIINTHLSFWAREQKIQAEALCNTDWLTHELCKGSVILCGDFNAQPRSAVCRSIAKYLKDVQLTAERHKPLNTWYGHFPLGRIDHIFVNKNMGVGRVEVPSSRLEKLASDHLPLIAEVHPSLHILRDRDQVPKSPAVINAI